LGQELVDSKSYRFTVLKTVCASVGAV